MSTRRNILIEVSVYLISIIACYMYFKGIGPIAQYGPTRLWARPANINDHLVYLYWARFQSISTLSPGDNNFGVSWIYNNLVNTDSEWEIYLLNMAFLSIGYFYYIKICRHYTLSYWATIAFTLNTFLMYFGLLINKDMATFAIIIMAAYFAIKRNIWGYAIIFPIAFLFRQQLGLFIACLFFLEAKFLNYSIRILIVFIFSSVVGIAALASFNFIDERTLGEGITGQLTAFFIQQRWLAPLGVPIRLILYIFDYLLSLAVFDHGRIDALKALRLPSIVFFAAACIKIPSVLHNRARYISFNAYRPIVSACVAYMAAVLINPQINARYITSLIPLLIILTFISNRRVSKDIYMRRLARENRREHGEAVQ